MGPYLKKLPIMAMAGLTASLLVASCGHGAEQRAASGGVSGVVAGALVAGPVGAVVGGVAGGAGGAATANANDEGR